MTTQHEMQIPFCGFYESFASWMIDDEIERSFDYEGTGYPDIPNEFWDHWDCSKVYPAFAEIYAERFNQWVNDYLGIELTMVYQDMSSPAYYNFTTDRIFVTISSFDVMKLITMTDRDVLAEVIRERHSSRPGFFSSYNNDINQGEWLKNPLDWDHNQLHTLLIAALQTKHVHDIDFWEIMEDIGCNGEIADIIHNNAPQKCVDLMNEYDERHRSQLKLFA